MKNNHRKRNITLYNIFLPIWLIVALPPFLLVTLPINYLIDWLVVRTSLKKQGNSKYKVIAKNITWRVWLIGFLCDFIGVVLMFLVEFLPGRYLNNLITNPVTFNCFSNPIAFLYVALCIVISGLLIYILNLKLNFRKITSLSLEEKKKLAKHLAIWTAPYLFLLPTRLI